MNIPNDAKPEASLPKALLFATGYFGLLFFSLSFAWNRYMDMTDPPRLDPGVSHSFLLSGFGGWLWFGVAFALPAAVLFAFRYFLARFWKGSGRVEEP